MSFDARMVLGLHNTLVSRMLPRNENIPFIMCMIEELSQQWTEENKIVCFT
jgi:hypothetical protein